MESSLSRAVPRRRTSTWLRLVRQQPLGVVGALILIVMIVVALFAGYVAPFEPTQANASARFTAPNAQYLLGTDQFGRDILSRLVWGARTSLVVAFGAMTLGVVLGTIIGLSAGYIRGWFDTVIQSLVDGMMTFPSLLLALALVAVLRPSIGNLIVALAFPIVPRVARIVRSSTLGIVNMAYIEAAKSLGAGPFRIVLRHVLPNCFAPIIVVATAYLGVAVLAEASLSYLGLGTQEPEASWGLMLAGSATDYARRAPWLPIVPGIALTLAVFASNLVGDALRDTLDPRLRQL